jgi:hypothetical protein
MEDWLVACRGISVDPSDTYVRNYVVNYCADEAATVIPAKGFRNMHCIQTIIL